MRGSFISISGPQYVSRRRRYLQASWWVATFIVLVLSSVLTARAQQDEEKPKVPGLDRIIAEEEHLAFTGTVKSVDQKRNIITIDSIEGSDTEIFPIKHSTYVLGTDGYKKRLAILSPGTNVIVYYDQRSDRRMVTRIEMLARASKKKEPHS